jgi:hypothetical protein
MELELSAAIALKGRNDFQKSAIPPQSVEEKALAFFQRAELAELNETQPHFNCRRYADDSAIRLRKSDESVLAFFMRAELSDALQGIWDSVKRLPFSTLLRLLKAVALVSATVLLTQSISLTGFLALAGTIAGLLLAAISNVLVWLIYIPMYAVRTSDFAFSILLALGLAWLAGVTPLVALVFSPMVLFGFRLLERSDLAKQNVSEIVTAVGGILHRVNVSAGIQQVAASVSGLASSILP